ncbi:3-hydroxyisobutyryl-CoA hydrolase mitochondrial [Fasciolopsis buskii]|uniref:3-hydroxyisobutyryl-CoA hydrolase mitochondrial n=1 Tax=Fasciolopsis buskii TaxID=27845 RepID=A0A8E0RY55_9TREM|nr:3-hydroxyisobutyryl-CoA hydrolase mitochondrial [Fasciolopsis buski]
MFPRLRLSSSRLTPLLRVKRFLYDKKWDTYELSLLGDHVLQVQLNRPEKHNAMGMAFWNETKEVFKSIQADPVVRAVVLSGRGETFSSGRSVTPLFPFSGMDLDEFPRVMAEVAHRDSSRCGLKLRRFIEEMQEVFSSLESCAKPIITAIQGGCIGAGVSMVAAADVRYCSQDAWFQVKELEFGIAADVGTIQRLPHLVGSESLARELIFTGRRFNAAEALTCGFISRVLGTHGEVVEAAVETAQRIAQLSPVAVQTSKRSLIYSRDHGVMEGLRHIVSSHIINFRSRLLMWTSSVLRDVSFCTL